MKNALFILLGIAIGANVVYLFNVVAMVLRHCGGLS